MTISKQYLQYVAEILQKTMDTQEEALEQAAELVCATCLNKGRFYVFGSGHSHMIAEELYIRAGGLAYVKAILPPELMLHEMPNKSTWLERLSGYAEAMLKLHKVDEKDTILIISNSGRNGLGKQKTWSQNNCHDIPAAFHTDNLPPCKRQKTV